MPAPLRSVSNPGPSTRQQPRPKPCPVPAHLNNELSINITSPTTSMGSQPRPNPHPIPAPLNEGLSIDTTSPMTSICHLQEVYGCKAEKMRHKSLKHPQAPALSSDDDVLSSPLVPHVGQKRL